MIWECLLPGAADGTRFMGVSLAMSAVQWKRPEPKARKKRLVVQYPARKSEIDDIGNHSSKVKGGCSEPTPVCLLPG